MAILTKFIKTGTKCAVVGGAVYVSVQQGVWSSSTQDGAAVLSRFRESVIPATSDYLKQIPKFGDVQQSMKSEWNSGVQWSAEAISRLPKSAYNAMMSGASYLGDTLFPVSGKDK